MCESIGHRPLRGRCPKGEEEGEKRRRKKKKKPKERKRERREERELIHLTLHLFPICGFLMLAKVVFPPFFFLPPFLPRI